MNQSTPLLTIEEAAKYLNMSTASVYRLINSGNLKSVSLLPRKQRLHIDELNRLIARSERTRHGNGGR